MLDALLRGPKDRLLLPLARLAGPAVSPNVVTVLALLAGLGAAVALGYGLWLWGLAAWIGNRVLDGVDGVLARAEGKQSDFGGYLDILCDFAVYAAIPIGVALEGPHRWPTMLAAAVLLATFYVNAASWMYLAALLEKRAHTSDARGQTSVVMPGGLIEGTETVVFFCLLILFASYAIPLMLAMAAGVLLTSLQRLLWAARHL